MYAYQAQPGSTRRTAFLVSPETRSEAVRRGPRTGSRSDDIIRAKLKSEHVYVQMSLDKSQAGGVHERDLLAQWDHDKFGNSIAIGSSSKSAISHLKICIIDGVYTIKGSTNWSLSGEQKQDNEMTISRNAVIAAETRALLDINHDWMLKQMAKAEAEGNADGKTSSRKFTRSTSGAKTP